SSKPTTSGRRSHDSAGSSASSAIAPYGVNPHTRSPGENPVPSPASTTTPASSYPGARGSSGFSWYRPETISVSAKFATADATRTRTVPGFTSGSGSSPTRRDSTPPKSSQIRARMGPSLRALQRGRPDTIRVVPRELPPPHYRIPDPRPEDDDVIAVGGGLDPGTILDAYRRGMFPMHLQDGRLAWWSPVER